ncbi:MAG: hypothetical protein HC828_19710, partial [Blastochloris sp.]|nr:hypothetical protein [Blastochloris sp.]
SNSIGNDNTNGVADYVEGDDGNDTIYGGNRNSIGDGNDGGDSLFGEAGNDTTYGGNFNSGGSGSDGEDIITPELA